MTYAWSHRRLAPCFVVFSLLGLVFGRAAQHSLKRPLTGKSQSTTADEDRALAHGVKATPNAVNGNVPPRRRPNRDTRTREYLTQKEVDALITAARKRGRHGHRDATMILLAYRHALRVGELVTLRWEQIDLSQGLLHVSRAKNGTPSTHPLRGPEIRALRRLQRD